MALRAITFAMFAVALFLMSFALGARLSAEPRPQGAPGSDVTDLPPLSFRATTSTIARLTSAEPFALTATTASTPPPATSAPPRDLHVDLEVDDVFAGIEPDLTADVAIPIRLPATLPEFSVELVPTLESTSTSGYVVHLGEDADCTGSSACRVATFTGRKRTTAQPVPLNGTPVPLPEGRTGLFVDSLCGGSCNNSFITWVEDDVRYSVGVRNASGQATLDLAWRTINATLPAPSGPEICGPGAPAHNGMVGRTITNDLPDGRQLHWIVLCSDAGTVVELVDQPGELRWLDVDANGTREPVIDHPDGSTSIFLLVDGEPRPAMDMANSQRLRIGSLQCESGEGGLRSVDAATDEALRFVGVRLVQRVERTTAGALAGCL